MAADKHVFWDGADLVIRNNDAYPITRTVVVASGGAPGAHATSHENGGSDEISVAGLSGLLADAQKVSVRKNSSPVGTRTQINFIEGTNITLTVVDDGTEIDVTIDASGGGGGSGFTNGTATLDFGAAPGSNTATVTVATGIGVGNMAFAQIMYESSADHNAEEHALLARYVGLTAYRVGLNTLGIEARSDLRITGAVSVRWGWSA